MTSIEMPWKPWQMVDEHVVAEITGVSLTSLRRDRSQSRGIAYRKLNGTTIRYLIRDVLAWIEAQPAGGDRRAEGKKPRKARSTEGDQIGHR
jgi:hypothetical protein